MVAFLIKCSQDDLSKQKQSVKWYKWIEFAWPSFPIGRVLVFWCGHSMYFPLSNHRLLSIIHFPYVKMRTPILEANSIEICSVMDTLIHDKWTPKTLIYAIDGGNIAYNTLCMWWRWADDYRFFVCFFQTFCVFLLVFLCVTHERSCSNYIVCSVF